MTACRLFNGCGARNIVNFVVGVLAGVLCIGSGAPRDARAQAAIESIAPEPLDPWTLPDVTTAVDIDPLDVATTACPHVDGVTPTAAISIGPGLLTLAWTHCHKQRCKGQVVTVSTGKTTTGRIVTRKTLPTPHKPFMVDGVQIEKFTLHDLDRDGQQELVILYKVTEPPRPALGSWVDFRMVVYNLPRLTPLWDTTLRRVGAGTDLECVSQLSYINAQAKPTVVLQQTRCARPDDSEKEATPNSPTHTSDKVWVYHPRRDRLIAGSRPKVPPRSTP